jgi:hypothetical protein
VFVSEVGVGVLLLVLVGEVDCVEGVLVEAVWWVEVSWSHWDRLLISALVT